jgi:arylsulfatase A-like enzyme
MDKRKPPHLLIFNPDQFRADALGHLGNPAAVTPNLDRLAHTDGVSFRNAFCQNPVCTPSRCSFMTGWYPHVQGHRTMFHMLHAHEPVLLKTLKDGGYTVWWGGKNDLVPGQGGYEDFCDVKHPEEAVAPNLHVSQDWRGDREGDNWFSFHAGKLTDVVAGSGDGRIPPHRPDSDWAHVLGAIDFIRNTPDDKPVCLYLPLGYPHPPYGVEDPWYSAIDREKVPLPLPEPEGWVGKPSLLKGIRERQRLRDWTPERFRELRATYYGMCSRLDTQFGLLMDALREKGVYDDTAIFVFSDHGDFTGDYGLVEKTQNTFEDCLTRVPFLFKPPADVSCVPGSGTRWWSWWIFRRPWRRCAASRPRTPTSESPSAAGRGRHTDAPGRRVLRRGPHPWRNALHGARHRESGQSVLPPCGAAAIRRPGAYQGGHGSDTHAQVCAPAVRIR